MTIINWPERQYIPRQSPRSAAGAGTLRKPLMGIHTTTIPTAADLAAAHAYYGGTLEVSGIGPRGLMSYSVHCMKGSIYLGVFDMTGEISKEVGRE